MLELLKRFGREAESFRCLSPGLRYWFSDDGEAVVAYVATGGSWVAAGSAVCDPQHLGRVLQAFAAAARAERRRAVLFAVEEHTIDALRALLGGASPHYTWAKIGQQPAFDPTVWSLEGAARHTVRAQVRRAANHRVQVREVPPCDLEHGTALRLAAEDLIAEWREFRPMSPMGFLVDLHPFRELEARRYFIAEYDGELVGLLAAVPIYARGGWFAEDLVRRSTAPNGTVEAMVAHALSALGAEGATYATLGVAPLSGEPLPKEQRGPGLHPFWLPTLFGLCYRHANLLYSFSGLRQFREKFRPDRWEMVYMAVSPPRITPPVLYDMLSAFVPGSRVTFAWDTLLRLSRALARRIPRPYLRWIAWVFSLMLIPWIGLLLSVDAEKRFGTTWDPWVWVSFDAAMGVAFALLAEALVRWPRFAWSLGRIMLGAVLADVWLTAAQVLLFNLPGAEGPLDVVVSCIAVLAPISAVVFLTVVALALQPRSPWHLAATEHRGSRSPGQMRHIDPGPSRTMSQERRPQEGRPQGARTGGSRPPMPGQQGSSTQDRKPSARRSGASRSSMTESQEK